MNTSNLTTKKENSLSQKSRRQWHACAFGGMVSYTLAYLFCRFIFIPGASDYLTLSIAVAPVMIVGSILKPTLKNRTKKLKDQLSKHSINTSNDFVKTYTDAINTKIDSIIQDAKKYKTIELIWAFISLYAISVMFTMFAFAILNLKK